MERLFFDFEEWAFGHEKVIVRSAGFNRSNDYFFTERLPQLKSGATWLKRSIVGGGGYTAPLRSRSAGSPNDCAPGGGKWVIVRSFTLSLKRESERLPPNDYFRWGGKAGAAGVRVVWGCLAVCGGVIIRGMSKPPVKSSPNAAARRGVGAVRKYDPAEWMPRICAHLAAGASLYEACAAAGPGAPSADAVMGWVQKDPEGLGRQYAHARETGYLLLGDKIDQLAAETHTYTLVPEVDADGVQLLDDKGEPRARRVLVPLGPDVIASKRLQIDALKWKLSKMLPKVYGDKVTQEHTGAGGGPIAIAGLDLKNLNDDELAKMHTLLSKVNGGAK